MTKKMKLEIRAAGELIYNVPQQQWHGEEPNIMQLSRYAGQEMMAIQKSEEEPEIYELHYLGFVAGNFNGIESAKNAAAEFAKNVLARLLNMIDE